MSDYLCLKASLDAETKLGKKVFTEQFELHKTPTKITHDILKLNDNDLILQAYSNWILSFLKDFYIDVHAEYDSIFYKREPIGKELRNLGKDHLRELQEWLDDHKGWDIEWNWKTNHSYMQQ